MKPYSMRKSGGGYKKFSADPQNFQTAIEVQV
jgi:hypothetical protein